MKKIPVALALSFAAGSAFAGANCPQYPKAEWIAGNKPVRG
jgi:hypothetical protein